MKPSTQHAPARRRGRSSATLLLLAVASLCLLSFRASRADQGQEPQDTVGDARTALEKWVQTRQLIAQAKSEWAEGRLMIEDRIGIVEEEIADFRSKISEAEENIAAAEKKRAELQERVDELESGQTAFRDAVVELETRVKALLPRLPEPLLENVRSLSQRIPENSEETDVDLSDRYMNIVGILNLVNKFHQSIDTFPEVRKLDDGRSAQVTVLYLGISKAFYATAKGDAAGVGTPTDEGWVWTSANDSAGEILRLIDVFNDAEAADFVRVPMEVK